MEQLGELFNIIGGMVTTVLLPLLGVFLFHDQKKRKEEAAARKAEADNITSYAAEWKKCYEEERAVESELNAKIDSLYEELNKRREELNELRKENTALELEKQKLEVKRCDVRGCANRQPPSDY